MSSRSSRAVSRSRLLTLTTLGALLVTGCAPSTSAPSPAEAVSVKNCDRTVTVEAPPQRIVSLTQQTTELLLALGLEDRMVGTAWWNEPVRADLAAAEAQVPRLAERNPSFETVLEVEPDFVVAGFDSMYTDEMVATRDGFEKLGIATWLTPAYCNGEQTALDDPYELQDLYDEVTTLATLFGVPERGEKLVAQLEQDVAEARAQVAALDLDEDFSTVFWYGTNEAPYMAGATGAPAVMTRALGIDNIYDDNLAMWPQVNWEDVMDRNPDLIVMADLSRDGEGQSMEDKIDYVTSDPGISQMPAVREEAWMAMRGMDLDPTINTVNGIQKLADHLVELHGDRS